MQRLEKSDDGDVTGGDLIRGAAMSRNTNQTARDASHVRLGHHRDADLVEYRLASGNYAGPEVVDVTKIDCLVGRVMTELGDNYVVERTSIVGHMDILDAVINSN
ncbi:hypothetical protein OPQ81_002874 [Rhizoctonia solani]|nr:hypothetical protein OPQ81_002874 [Rhizoctonia solani]